MEDVHRRQVVVRAQKLFDRIEPQREIDHFLHVRERLRVTRIGARDGDRVQRTDTEIVEPELLRRGESFEAELDRRVDPAGEHLVARTLVENRRVRTRRGLVGNVRACFVEERLHLLATAPLPADVGQYQRRLRGGLAPVGSEQSSTRLQ